MAVKSQAGRSAPVRPPANRIAAEPRSAEKEGASYAKKVTVKPGETVEVELVAKSRD